jgi:NADH dehydrogenase
VPTLNRKVRVIADWTAALFFPREVVSLGQLQMPLNEWQTATGTNRDITPPASKVADGAA